MDEVKVDYSRYQMLLVERTRNVLRVTLNRPDELNAINRQLHRELSTIFADAQRDDEVDVIVLTGAGGAFSAGGDWNWMRELITDPTMAMHSILPEGKRIICTILDCEKPIICRLNGDAIGHGCTISLFCDFVIAVDTARLADPHTKVGLVTGDGSAVIWPHLVGYARAKRYLLTGDYIGAKEAAAIGLITQAVPAEELDATVDALVKRMARSATRAVGWSKAVINSNLRVALAASIDGSLAYEALSSETADHKAAVEALLDRRKPVFASSTRA
jgi:enoyl-CoA hydratase